MSRKFVVLSFLSGACLIASLFTGVSPAQATYPGINGRLAFGLDTGNGNIDVYSVTRNGNDLQRLTAGPSFDACTAPKPGRAQRSRERGCGGRWPSPCPSVNGSMAPCPGSREWLVGTGPSSHRHAGGW
jgi:hypothetical protein